MSNGGAGAGREAGATTERTKRAIVRFETARLVETLDEPRDDADIELLVLRLLVAAESDVEPRPPLEFVAGALPRELANVLEFVLPRAVVAEFVEPLRPKFDE